MSFSVDLAKCHADPKVVDKSAYIEYTDSFTGVLKEGTSIVNPVILVESDTMPEGNYCEISVFNRFYYITDIVSVRNKLWEIHLQCDVLYTYKTVILKSYGYVDRVEFGYNRKIVDDMVTIENEPEIVYRTLNNDVFVGQYDFLITGYDVSSCIPEQ